MNNISPSVTLVRHHHNEAELNDTVTRHFKRRGYAVNHVFPFDGDVLDTRAAQVGPSVILGGGQNVTDIENLDYLQNEIDWINACIEQKQPLLGICLGAQLLAHALGATVSERTPRECEFGFYPITPVEAARGWLPVTQYFTQAHFQEFSLPDGATLLASSERFPNQAFRYNENTYAVQFHPEVTTAIFEDWQADDWSNEMSATTGAQSEQEQSRLLSLHIDAQVEWFENFLDQLFGLQHT